VQGNVQGPFRTSEMRQWHEAGYFKPQLHMRLGEQGPFRMLAEMYPNLDEAFVRAPARPQPQPQAQAQPQHAGHMLLQQLQQQQQQQLVRMPKPTYTERGEAPLSRVT
jgi:hypothetical protein